MEVEPDYVVSMIAPLPEADAFDAAGGVAPRLGLERDRLARLLSRRPGPITRPLERVQAERIADMLVAAGVSVRVEPTERLRTPPEDLWVGFDVDPPTTEFDVRWGHDAEPAGVSSAGHVPRSRETPTPYAPPDMPYRQRTRPEEDVPARAEVERHWDEVPDFDWDQPLGIARWRRPLLLVLLALALGAFVWLQVALSPAGASPSAADTYDRGLHAYRTGDFRAALRFWESAGDAGDARALYMLGYMSEFGQGQAWSNRRAAEYYRQAGERGSARAQFALASLYERGLGVPHSQRTAVRWYGIAAQNGHAEAQHRLALAYLQGRGVERDWTTALHWFERAAAGGMRDAEPFLAVLRAVTDSAGATEVRAP